MAELNDKTYERISALMQDSIGLSFGPNKKPLISSRLAPRMHRLGIESYEEYLELIADEAHADEFQMAVDLLTTNETYFFREPQHFDRMVDEIGRRRGGGFDVWSAASSFGDEIYSIAMVLADQQAAGRLGSSWSVLGTDISHRVLLAAKAAIYPEERLRHVTRDRLQRYCLRGEGESAGQVKIKDSLCRHVRFGQLNLMQDFEGIGPFDCIFLRNVLIYFDMPTKIAVVDRVLSALKPGGIFFIGMAEGRVPCRTPLEYLGPGAFRKSV